MGNAITANNGIVANIGNGANESGVWKKPYIGFGMNGLSNMVFSNEQSNNGSTGLSYNKLGILGKAIY